MKRNNSTVRSAHMAARHASGAVESKSKYARKVKAGNQMYGPGCCGHKIKDDQIQQAKRAARREGIAAFEYYQPE